jgi:hypothetical protein
MAVWEWILVMFLAVKLILIVITLISPPPFVKKWLVSRFELHPQLNEESVSVTINEKPLMGEDKKQWVDYFNQATFLKKYDWVPKRDETAPLVIESEQGKKKIRFSLYIRESRVDVFREYKKKVVAYYISSDNIPEDYACAN